MRTEWVHCVAGHSWETEVMTEHGDVFPVPGVGGETCRECKRKGVSRDWFDWGRYDTVLAWKIPMVRVMEYVAEIKDAKEQLERIRLENTDIPDEDAYRTLLEEVVND